MKWASRRLAIILLSHESRHEFVASHSSRKGKVAATSRVHTAAR